MRGKGGDYAQIVSSQGGNYAWQGGGDYAWIKSKTNRVFHKWAKQ